MKFKLFTLALALPVMSFLASCGGEDEAAKPTITLESGGITANKDVEAGSKVSFKIKAVSASGTLSGVTIIATYGTKSVTVLDTATGAADMIFTKTIDAIGSPGDDVKYTFTAKDGNGASSSVAVTLSVIPIMASLDGQSGFQIYNANSSGLTTSFDLAKGQPNPGALPLKDIIDGTTSGSAQWSKSWASANGSTFCKVSANDWVNGNSTDYLFNLWKANKDKMTATYTNLTKDDVILVRSGQVLDFNLFILKITGVTDLPAVGNNNDFAQFDFKGVIL
ncbi:MAG: hypothetical protein NBV77_01445 [Bacteroidia bacterium]|nr:hypothetical protein [Bacteroidia bacterium]